MRTITAPGVEWREIDRSGYSPAMTGTACYILGFANKGEAYKPMEFTSRAAWTSYYGEPDNEAERYFYAAACEVLNQNGRLYCARLPYDNEAFEKMVGYKYNVSDMKTDLSNVDTDGQYAKITEADPDINEYCVITGTKEPILYELTAIDEYRTDEAKVPANTFLIVDTTGATYSKITEDTRKGTARELIGIVPIVTTAANALYAQSLIDVEDYEAKWFEPIKNKILNTLSGSSISANNVAISGILEDDLTKKINTWGFYKEQTHAFTMRSIFKGSSTEPVEYDLGDTFRNWYETITKFISDYKLTGTYSIDTLGGIMNFYNNIKVEDAPTFFESGTVAELKLSTENAMKAITSSDTKWYYLNDDEEQVEVKEDLSVLTANYAKLAASGEPLWTSKKSYVNPDSVKIVENEDGSYRTIASMFEASELAAPEWHGKDGDDSLPETMCLDANNYFSTIQPANDGVGFDPEHLKDIGVVVYKLYLDAAEGNKVSWEPVEAYCGSLYKDDKDPNTGVTKFIDTIINSQSQYINFFSNCFSATKRKNDYLKKLDILVAEPSSGASLGLYSYMTKEDISISKSILDGFNKSTEKVSDIIERDIDIVCDAGLANIASYLKAIYNDKGAYDLGVTDDLGNSMLGLWTCKKATDPAVKMWKTVEQKFDTFCKKTRKDCMFIADGLRPLVLQGQKKIIRDSKPANTLDVNVIPYLPAICGLNTSYGAGYVDWFEQADDYTGDFFWCPPSIKAMGVYINTDVNFNYWDAPAGLNRGTIAATDVAFSPTPKQAGCFYEKNWNFAINYPNDGIVLEGQKTFQVKPSAFDRVNVRRLFLRLERAAFKVARYFVYEGHTAYTRQRFVDAIDPYFKQAKANGGIYDYMIICDESINTPEVIDNNELRVKIGIKPVKTIEFIMMDFIAGSTGGSWDEIMK